MASTALTNLAFRGSDGDPGADAPGNGLTADDKNKRISATIITDADKTGLTITNNPVNYVGVAINGIQRVVSNGSRKGDAFFSADDIGPQELRAGSLTSFLLGNGNAWSTGENTSGQCGDNTNQDRSSPVSVVGNHSFGRLVSHGNFTLCLKRDGTAWTWGYGTSGQMGNNSNTNRSSPVSVVGNHSFSFIGASTVSGIAMKSTGTAWTWGSGSNGRLGQGNSVANRSSPVSVVGNHTFRMVSGGSNNNRGLKSNGQVWSWGSGTNGENGSGSSVNRSSPVLVAGNHSFIDLVGPFGLKVVGTVWGWGVNNYGQIGDNSTSNRNSPVSVVGNHSFVKISRSGNHTLGLKDDGTAWGWGQGTSGQLGQNSAIVNRSSPVSVVGNHSFVRLAVGAAFSVGLKDDGTMWAWGANANGQIGDNTTSNRSSPVSVLLGAFPFPVARAVGSIQAGDNLYLNADSIGSNVRTTDRIDMNYIEE